MKDIIDKELKQLETGKNLTILFACESGSRAWGFHSPDSDYDVRFIYIRPVNHYLSIRKHKNHIDMPITGDLDINGWDLGKTLNLLASSNATVFEWLQSPIIYKTHKDFREKLFQLARRYFSPRTTIHHYLGLAKKGVPPPPDTPPETEPPPQPKEIHIKKYFYILRPLLAAMWIAQRETIPPMEFHKLLPLIETRENLMTAIDTLLEKKARAKEKETTPTVPIIQDFVQREYEDCRAAAKNFPSVKNDMEPLDEFFREMLYQSSVDRLQSSVISKKKEEKRGLR